VQFDPSILIFLSSGLFLGWALGANDAANVFGTAVGTRMIPWLTAAIVCSVFLILGAVISGAGAAQTLGKLGAISTPAGAFMTALSAAIAVYTMTKAGLPVSTTQAIVGGIVGWNLFSGTATDTNTLTTILLTWIICPLLAAGIAMTLYTVTVAVLRKSNLHLLRIDAYTRIGLIVAGAFGAYSLGANNIANVVGVFLPSSPFQAFTIGDFYTVSAAQQLFFIGALAIGVGVLTYSKGVMMTVGSSLGRITPVAAWVAVTSHYRAVFVGLQRAGNMACQQWPANNSIGSRLQFASRCWRSCGDCHFKRYGGHPVAAAWQDHAGMGCNPVSGRCDLFYRPVLPAKCFFPGCFLNQQCFSK